MNKNKTRPASGPVQAKHRLALAVQSVLLALGPCAVWAQTAQDGANQVPVLNTVEVRATSEQSQQNPGANTTLSGEELERAKSMEDMVRYQPLVSAPGVASGASRNKSSFDRGGTTGYNIRGVEGNRIGMDVDGVELPSATTRPYVSRVGNNTFGVGRDFIDPEMFSSATIDSGTTTARRSAGGIGGAVGFKTKAPENYLKDDKTSYFAGKLSYDSADGSWNESVTAAGRAGKLDGLIAYSRRDGHEVENNSSTVDAYPDDWHSDALLLKGGVRLNAENRLVLSADLYRRENRTEFDAWNTAGTAITEESKQDSDTERDTLQLQHQWMPVASFVDSLDTRLYVQNTETKDVTQTTTLPSGPAAHNISSNKTRSVGLSSAADKNVGDQRLSFGINGSTEDAERPWSNTVYMKPQPDTTTTRLGAFVQDEIKFYPGGKRLAVIPAYRVDRVEIESRNLDEFVSGALTLADAQRIYGSTATNTIQSPSLGVVYDLTPTLSSYAQYKRSGRAPGAGEIFGSWNMNANYSATQYALVGNRDLKAETSDAFDLGIKGSPMPGVTLNSSVFYTKYEDFIAYTRYSRAVAAHASKFTNVPSNISIIYQAENRDEATIYGFEFSSRLDHGHWWQAAQGVYSTWALGVSKGTSKSNYDGDKEVELDSVPPAKAVVGVGFDAPQKSWGWNLTGIFVDSKQAKATNRESYSNSGTPLTESTVELFDVPGYSIFDLTSYWQVTKTVRANVGVYNLGDKRYWDYASARSLQPSVARDQRDIELLTNPGRTFAVSVSAVF